MKKRGDQYFIVDAHLDLSMNGVEWNRDLRWSVDEIRKSESEMTDKPDRGNNTVSFREMQSGNIGLCVATQIGRYVKKGSSLPGWNSPEQAWSMTQAQRIWYQEMVKSDELTQIVDKKSLNDHLESWNANSDSPIGYVLTLEGADSLISLDYLETAYEYGLRALGPAHYGPGTYAQGTNATGGIGQRGRDLLAKMQELNIIMDATHLCDDSFREAMDHFKGRVWASHSNCRVFVDHNRQFTNDQLKELIERDAVIGAPLDAWMMVPDWIRGKSDPKDREVTLDIMVKNIDHVCQLAGNSQHAAIGTDLDGAFGTEQTPHDLNTIADLQKLPAILSRWGYTEQDINNILHENWIRFLRETWS